MAPPAWLVDAARAPLIIIRLPEPPKEPPDIDRLISEVTAMLARREKLVLVYDTTYANPNAARRKRTAHFINENAENIRRYVVACAVVAPTALQRGVLIALKWLHTPVVPVETFGDLPAATTWAETTASRAGLVVPPSRSSMM